jgi:hypothetical protein
MRIPLFPWGREGLQPLRRGLRRGAYWGLVALLTATFSASLVLASGGRTGMLSALALLEIVLVALAAALFALLSSQALRRKALLPRTAWETVRGSVWLALLTTIGAAVVVGLAGVLVS